MAASSSQAVQRCRALRDERYGAVHALARSGNATMCGKRVSSREWWVLGSVEEHLVTCRLCIEAMRNGTATANR